jgi:hypothetical protein
MGKSKEIDPSSVDLKLNFQLSKSSIRDHGRLCHGCIRPKTLILVVSVLENHESLKAEVPCYGRPEPSFATAVSFKSVVLHLRPVS